MKLGFKPANVLKTSTSRVIRFFVCTVIPLSIVSNWSNESSSSLYMAFRPLLCILFIWVLMITGEIAEYSVFSLNIQQFS